MQAKRIQSQHMYGQRSEKQILDQIVEAMLEVATDLQDASPEEWGQILVRSCRRHKRSSRVAAAGC
jgi:hypothetical protein